jgi:hypothetical protein
VRDRLSNGRPYKMLTVLNEYTREALSVTVSTKVGANEVLGALYPLLLTRGQPTYLRSDNGAEFSAAPPSLAEAAVHNTHPDLSGLPLGKRIQRALQGHPMP